MSYTYLQSRKTLLYSAIVYKINVAKIFLQTMFFCNVDDLLFRRFQFRQYNDLTTAMNKITKINYLEMNQSVLSKLQKRVAAQCFFTYPSSTLQWHFQIRLHNSCMIRENPAFH